MTTITIEKAIVHRALSALEYHTQQTRPIHNTELVIEELRAALSAPATEPAPMHEGEIQAAWLGQNINETMPYTFVLGIRSAERFNGILPAPEDK